MKLSEIYKIADELAPKGLSDEYCASYGAYDNSGVLVDTGDEINGILFTLDLSNAAIEKAIAIGANLIITHHPVIYGKIDHVCEWDPLGKKLVRCIKNGISVISMHLNLDLAEGGIDESLQQAVCLAAGGAHAENECSMHSVCFEKYGNAEKSVWGSYGRAYDITPCSLENLQAGLKRELNTKRILYYGEKDRVIKRVASFCGAGVDEESISFTVDNIGENADVIISSDFKHHLITRALEEGLAVIVLTHYASENYGFQKYYEKIRRQVEIPCVYHTDEHLL